MDDSGYGCCLLGDWGGSRALCGIRYADGLCCIGDTDVAVDCDPLCCHCKVETGMIRATFVDLVLHYLCFSAELFR